MHQKSSQRVESNGKKNIRIPDLLKKSREKAVHKQQKKGGSNESIDIQYGTDSKKCSKNHSYYAELQQMKIVMQSCNSCLEKISQFKTKKPDKLFQIEAGCKQQKGTQTTNKPFLINLIEERVTELYRYNKKLTRILAEKEIQLADRHGQISEIQDKFTNILYTLGQELSELKLNKQDAQQFQQNLSTNTQTPSYLKALMMDRML